MKMILLASLSQYRGKYMLKRESKKSYKNVVSYQMRSGERNCMNTPKNKESWTGLRYGLVAILMCGISTNIAWSQSNDAQFELPKEFSSLTSHNVAGYFKPLLTTLSEGLHSNYFTSAVYPEKFSVGIDISAQMMLVPSEQKVFTAELPQAFSSYRVAELRDGEVVRLNGVMTQQPTIYGGKATPVFAAAQTGFVMPVTFLEGANINTVISIPNLQLLLGIPTRTQVRLRFVPITIDNTYKLTYYSIGLNQQIDKLFGNVQDNTAGIAIHANYQRLSLSGVGDMTLLAGGIHASKSIDFLTGYIGAQLERTSGAFEAKRSTSVQLLSSPYQEVRLLQPMKLEVEVFNSYRIVAGVSLRLAIVEFHLEAGYTAQPFASAGLTFWLF